MGFAEVAERATKARNRMDRDIARAATTFARKKGWIEKHLHHVWVGGAAPTQLLTACRESMIELHSSWRARYWDKTSLCEELSEYYRDYREAFTFEDGYVKADVLRYLILHKYGGFYVDHDVWGVRPFDELQSRQIVFGVHKFGRDLKRFLITNAVLGAPAGSAFLLEAASHTLAALASHPCAKKRARAQMSGLSYIARKHHFRPCPFRYFHPHYYKEPTRRYQVFADTYSIHLWHRKLTYDVSRLRAVTESACRGT